MDSKHTYTKPIILTLVVFTLLLIVGLYVYNAPTLDIRKAKTEISIHTDELSRSFGVKDSVNFSSYIEKAIEVEGILHKVTYKKGRYTLFLRGSEVDTFVLCELQEDQNPIVTLLKNGDKIQVKGILKGFLKDTILLNCIILSEVYE